MNDNSDPHLLVHKPSILHSSARTYSVLLFVFGFLLLLSLAFFSYVSSMIPLIDHPNPFALGSLFALLFHLNLIYAISSLAVAFYGSISPQSSRPLTLALNVVLLLHFPFGTALGTYGFIVNRTKSEIDE